MKVQGVEGVGPVTASGLGDTKSLFENIGSLLGQQQMAVLVVQDECPSFVNQAMLDLLNFTGDDNKFKEISVWSWLHPDDLPYVRDMHGKRISELIGPSDYDFRLLTTDKKIRWVNCSAQSIDWDGEKAYFYVFKDITRFKQEQTDNHNNTLFQSIFSLSPDIMVLVNSDLSRIHDVNPAFLNVFGWRRDQVIGQALTDLGLCADPIFIERFHHELQVNTSIVDMPTALRVRGGLVRYFRLYVHKIEFAAESFSLLVAKDITDDLSQTQELERSRNDAELANRAKSEFLANMSHELRTPLNAILGFAEMIDGEFWGEVGNDKYREYAQDIHKSGTHLLSIINDILDLSKIEAGRVDSHLSQINPVSAIAMCVNLMRQKASDVQLTIEEGYEDGHMIEGDERLVRQIGLNLLSNSIKFTKPGGMIKVRFGAHGAGDVCLEVSDTGIGMTSEEIKVAKRPFGQIPSELSKNHRGSGLGLSLVTTFARRMNATMRIRSAPNEGTTVSIFFPKIS